MSRFDDQLERDFAVIADRVNASPSPDAWAAIQHRIATREPHQDTEIIMLTDNSQPTRRWPLVTAAAAIAALAIGAIALTSRNNDTEVPLDPAPPTVSPAPDTGTVEEFSELPPEGQTVRPGRYPIENLGVPVEIVVPDDGTDWIVQDTSLIGVTLNDGTGFVNLSRFGSLYDADQAQDPATTGLGSIAPDDIDAWIAANGMIVDDSRDVTVGGRSATYRQVRAPADAGQSICPPGFEPCVALSSGSADLQEAWNQPTTIVDGELPHSFWIVELEDFEPLGIWAHTASPDNDAWLTKITPLIDSITIGDPAPATPNGTARLSTFDRS